MLRVHECNADDRERWDLYVDHHDEGSFFHQFDWRRVFEDGLGHRTFYLLAEDNDHVVGVLPLVYMRSLLFGKTLSSLPFATFAGTLADNADAATALEKAASRLGQDLNVGTVEFRQRQPGLCGRPVKSLYDIFTKPIDPDPDANMAAIRSKQRNVIRKGFKNGLSSQIDTVDNFYAAYTESVRNLGTPVFPRSLFTTIQETFPATVAIISAHLDGKVISSSMNFFYKDWVCPYFWGGTYEARRLNGNDLLAWEIMQHAAQRGSRVFDFGRSKKESGPYSWKLNLGFTPAPLYYEYELVRDAAIPEVNPTNPKYRLMIAAWKKMPLPLARTLGPLLSRTLG